MVDINATLDPTPNTDPVDNSQNKSVQTALELMRQSFTDKNTQDVRNEQAFNLVEEFADMDEVDAPRLIGAKKGYQAFWKTMSRVKPLDFSVHGVGVPEDFERMMQSAVSTVLTRAGFYTSLMAKGGAMGNAFGIGDGFMLFGTQKQGFPFKFTPIPNNNVYVDTRATHMRMGARPAKKCAVIIEYTLAEFNRLYPKFKKKVGVGEIPRSELARRDLDMTSTQKFQEEDTADKVEVCHYFDISNECHVIFAGSSLTKIDENKGKDYPFRFTDPNTNQEELYIPVIQFIGMPSFQGFYNYGLFNSLYDLIIVYRRLLNKSVIHAEDNANPIPIVSVGADQTGQVFQQLNAAQKAREKGKKPMIALEYTGAGATPIGVNTLSTNSNVSEAQLMMDLLDREVKRLGVHLDELEQSNVTATQILSEEENANMFVKQIMEYNAPEFEFVVNLVLAQLKGMRKSDKTPINMTTTIRIQGEPVPVKQVTMGTVAAELKENYYFSKVNSRSGAIAPKARLERIARGLNSALPGSPAQIKLLDEYAALNDLDIPGEDFVLSQQEGPSPEEVDVTEVAATERQAINPRSPEPAPAI